MLVLTRKLTQEVYIGPLVVVRVVAVQDGKVKLGFEAPPVVKILRAELDIPRLTRLPDLLTAAQREEEMRGEGSRRFVREAWA